jgi:hypothetical protein
VAKAKRKDRAEGVVVHVAEIVNVAVEIVRIVVGVVIVATEVIAEIVVTAARGEIAMSAPLNRANVNSANR